MRVTQSRFKHQSNSTWGSPARTAWLGVFGGICRKPSSRSLGLVLVLVPLLTPNSFHRKHFLCLLFYISSSMKQYVGLYFLYPNILYPSVFEKSKFQYTDHTATIFCGGENVILTFYKWGNWDSQKVRLVQSQGFAEMPVQDWNPILLILKLDSPPASPPLPASLSLWF